MNITTVSVGIAMVAFGFSTTALRIWRPSAFSKLGPMKQRWGERAGLWLHVFGYSVVPIVSGIVIAIGGFVGVRLF